MRDVRTIILAAVSRRDLCYVSENEGFRFGKKYQILSVIWSVICPRNLPRNLLLSGVINTLVTPNPR